MTTITNIYLDQGTSYSSVIDMANDDGTAFNLQNYTASAQIKRAYHSSTSVNFTTTIDTVNSAVILSLTKEQTSSLDAGRYVYDLLIEDNTGNAIRVIEGLIIVNPSVTR